MSRKKMATVVKEKSSGLSWKQLKTVENASKNIIDGQ